MKSLSQVAIVGRPNVGKSTLFNVLTKTRNALVADIPGVTRDRQMGVYTDDDVQFELVDTCGYSLEEDTISTLMKAQLKEALKDADCILFVVDGRKGLLAVDEEIANTLRQTAKSVIVVVNKTDGIQPEVAMADFYMLGFDKLVATAAAHKRGLHQLVEAITPLITNPEVQDTAEDVPSPTKVAVFGRPNVGKSTLINNIANEQRVIVCDMPGTTRDTIHVHIERMGKTYDFMDTAGLRRKARITDMVEKFSTMKALEAVKKSEIVLMLLNAQEDIFDQDLKLINEALKLGKGVVIAINKWDKLDGEQKEHIKKTLSYKLNFVHRIPILTISALHGTGVGALFDKINEINDARQRNYTSHELTRVLEQLVAKHPPPLHQGRRIKLKYMNCASHNPLKFLIHGNQTSALPANYVKYLQKSIMAEFHIVGIPLKLEFRSGDNPYAGRKNALTERQMKKRQRMMRHYKKA